MQNRLKNMLDQHARGDTIVEVLIALAVLGLAFSISYATANRSLIMARNAQEHSEALQYLDSQVELARADSGDDDLYDKTKTLCMDQATSDINYGKPIPATSIFCTVGERYKVSYTYDNAPMNGVDQDVFTFKVTWDGIGTLGPQQETMSYKIHKLTGN